ncbi:MAG: hypothetical protein IPP39_13005 [Chitinophagaceae bacterium]|nr:hypothetical protein [Chitinophagaceae bacterium]
MIARYRQKPIDDNYKGALDATTHLIKSGYHRIAKRFPTCVAIHWQ